MLLYRNSLGVPFVYDDLDQVQTNAQLLSWHSLVSHYVAAAHPFNTAFRGPGGASYRPVFWFSLALDRHLFGLNVVGFHLTNLVLHWTNGILVFVLCTRLGLSRFLAGSTALIWLALPINSESVAWVSGRGYCWLALFVLVGLICVERYLRDGSRSALLGYGAAHIGALLSHEAGTVLLPCVILLVYSRSRTGSHSRRVLYLVAGGITVGYACLRAGTLGFSGGHHAWAILPVGTTVLKYVTWILFPLEMSIERSTDTPPDIPSLLNIGGLSVVLLLLVVTFRLRRKVPEIWAGAAWTVLTLLPFSGLVFLYQGMAERYCYLAAIGVVLIVVSLSWRVRGNARYVALSLLAIWVCWGGWRLNARLSDWHNEVSLYASSLKADPDSPVLLANLGSALGDAGHLGDGLFLITRAISLKPDYAFAYQAQGNLWFRLGGFEEAKTSYRKAIAFEPTDVKSTINLGTVYMKLKDMASAEAEFKRAIELAPRDVVPYCDLGVVLLNEGRAAEAVEKLATAIRIDPANANPYYFLGFTEEQTGAREAARQMYERALQIQPNYREARAGLSRLGQ